MELNEKVNKHKQITKLVYYPQSLKFSSIMRLHSQLHINSTYRLSNATNINFIQEDSEPALARLIANINKIELARSTCNSSATCETTSVFAIYLV